VTDAAARSRRRSYLAPKKRWVKVAMKLISISRPTSASAAASLVMGSSREMPPGKKPRPWKDVTLKTSAVSGAKWTLPWVWPRKKYAAAKNTTTKI